MDRIPFEEMMRPRVPLLYRHICTRLSDHHDANDIVQETMLAAWKGYGTYDGQSSVNAWLLSIARYKTADLYRKHYQQPTEAMDENLLAHDEIEQANTRLDIIDMLNVLTAGEKEPVYLVLEAGLTNAEAAKVLSIPVGTVKSRLHAVRKKMKNAKE